MTEQNINKQWIVDKKYIAENTCPECKTDGPDKIYFPWCGKSCFRQSAVKAGVELAEKIIDPRYARSGRHTAEPDFIKT